MRVSSPRWHTLAVTTLLVLVVCYAALLRLDALFKSYGPYDQPRWLAALQPAVGAAASTLTPDWPWRHDPTPYVGGDPVNYLKFARGMRNFYAAHVREPMFPAATRIGLMRSAVSALVPEAVADLSCSCRILSSAWPAST